MKRSQLLDELTCRILLIEQPHPVRVAIDGPDAAGKTTLADELRALLQARGQSVIRASIDSFHNPRRIRYRRGATSPEGYYYDSFNYGVLIESLLSPLGPSGSRQYRSAVFDYRADSEVHAPIQLAEINAVLLLDGVFLLRGELIEYWDFTIFVEASFETTLARAERRNQASFGSLAKARYEQRYMPGQKLYFETCRPKELARVIVNNNDLQNPELLLSRGVYSETAN